MLALVMIFPFLRELFKFAPLHRWEVALIGLSGAASILIAESIKLNPFRRFIYRDEIGKGEKKPISLLVLKENPMSKPARFFLLVIASAFSLCLALLGLETLHENSLGWFLLVLGIGYPAGGVIYYFIRREPFWESVQAGETVQAEATDRSFWAILPGFIFVFFAPPAEWYYMVIFLPRTLPMEVTGWVMVAMGAALLLWARLYLREYYSGQIRIGFRHELIQSGPYRFIRHPSYAGMLLVGLGVTFGYSSWLGFLAVPLLLIPGLVYRITVEERLLSNRFGDEYFQYRSRTKKLIPGIW